MEVEGVSVQRLREKPGVALTLGLWALVVAGVCASSMVGHVMPLPRSEQASVASGVSTLKAVVGPSDIVVFHFVDSKCRCSRRVVDGLVSRRPMSGVVEHVVLVDDDGLGARLRTAGFVVTPIPAKDLESRFGVRGAPLLLVVGRRDEVLYEGGYTDRKQAFALEDKRIVAEVLEGRRPSALPMFGCAVSTKLNRERNPMRIPWGDR
jgi:hypothetical protein